MRFPRHTLLLWTLGTLLHCRMKWLLCSLFFVWASSALFANAGRMSPVAVLAPEILSAGGVAVRADHVEAISPTASSYNHTSKWDWMPQVPAFRLSAFAKHGSRLVVDYSTLVLMLKMLKSSTAEAAVRLKGVK